MHVDDGADVVTQHMCPCGCECIGLAERAKHLEACLRASEEGAHADALRRAKELGECRRELQQAWEECGRYVDSARRVARYVIRRARRFCGSPPRSLTAILGDAQRILETP